MEVGSCAGSPYGLFVFVWSRGCGFTDECPDQANSYGFVVVAPSHGWSFAEFQDLIGRSLDAWQSRRSPGTPLSTSSTTIDVPEGPTAFRLPDGTWQGIAGTGRTHAVSFRWRLPDDHSAAITNDSGPAGALIAKVGVNTNAWPLAASVTTTPAGGAGRLVESTGNGCFTVVGPATTPDPSALVVDLRQTTHRVTETVASALGSACR
jgi:hypothetical protein